MTRHHWLAIFFVIFLSALGFFQGQAFYSLFTVSAELPVRFDLRSQKSAPDLRVQAWGTCWIFATYASMESDLLMTGEWSRFEEGRPELAVYHLDKFSGFTRKGEDSHVQSGWYSGQGSRYKGTNTDDLSTGLVVHLGGDYKAAAAFLTRTKGAVQRRLVPQIGPEGDHELFGDTQDEGVLLENDYTYFFPRQIEWLSLWGTDEEKRAKIKKEIMKGQAVASSQVMDDHPLGYAADGLEIHAHLSGEEKLTHAINLIGWDDEVEWNGHRGAWLAQDSDHKDEGTGDPIGYFYVLYDDYYAAKDDWMGGVTFRDVVKNPYSKIYSHALHGAQYSSSEDENVQAVAVRFTREKSSEKLAAVGFYSFAQSDRYEITIRERLEGEILTKKKGAVSYAGYHLIELNQMVAIDELSEFVVTLELQGLDYVYDAPFEMEVALGLPPWGEPIFVNSRAKLNEGFALNARGEWIDFHDYHLEEPESSSLAIQVYTISP